MATQRKFDPLVWGISLTLFAAFVVGGTIFGGKYRYSWALMDVPWGNKAEDVPKSPQEAWLWISFANDALAAGVSAEEIKKVYRKSKDSNVPIDMSNIPWPSFSRGKGKTEKPDSNKDEEKEPKFEYPSVRPGASPH